MVQFLIILGIVIYAAIAIITYILTFDGKPLKFDFISLEFGLLWPFILVYLIVDWIIEDRQVPSDF